ncbi:tyrosinase-like protein 1 [Pecten maximus]|uniref:tyrosinase-like protein 1 n=1 Tax=Pecten maximus TaxID=6579 RepID=UPI001457F7DE|nr:tyrosinase-like protein 1 [Pecten maximus]
MRTGSMQWLLVITVAVCACTAIVKATVNTHSSTLYDKCLYNQSVVSLDLPPLALRRECIELFSLDITNNLSTYNITSDESLYIESLLRKVISDISPGHRGKRQINRWNRREVRTLSPREWRRFTTRLNVLKRQRLGNSNRYDAIANVHRGAVLNSAHGGPNFLGWHRVYLLILEAATQYPTPYWDSSLDFHMSDPTQSVLWSGEFFGTGFGTVDDGPFASWITPSGISLVRNIGNAGSLISQDGVRNVLSRTRHREIVEPSPNPLFSLEAYHNGPHVWVDGQLSSPMTAAQDPIFFLHHAFIDYIWELFRTRQRRIGIMSAFDYPRVQNPLHRPGRIMDGWPFIRGLRNIDGFNERFARMTSYSRSPTCARCYNPTWPFPVLQCDVGNRRCISAPVPPQDTVAFASAMNRGNQVARARSSVERIGPLPIGGKFESVFTDARVRGDTLPYGPVNN